MSADRDALLKAILTFPDEDVPRLQYADWLQEHDQSERAAFIRLQIFAGRRPPVQHDKHCGRRGAGSSFLKTYGRLWPLDTTCRKCAGAQAERLPLERPDLWRQWFALPPGVTIVRVTRGFVEAVECAGATWIAHADAVAARHPVRQVTLTEPATSGGRSDGVPLPLSWFAGRWPGIEFTQG